MSTQIINYQLSQLFIMFAWRKGSDSEALKPMFTWDLVTANSGPFICLLFVKESERLHFEVFRLWSPNIPNKPISQTWIHSHQKMVSHEGFKVNQKQKRHSKNTHTHRQSTIYHPTNHSETNQQKHQILSIVPNLHQGHFGWTTRSLTSTNCSLGLPRPQMRCRRPTSRLWMHSSKLTWQ